MITEQFELIPITDNDSLPDYKSCNFNLEISYFCNICSELCSFLVTYYVQYQTFW